MSNSADTFFYRAYGLVIESELACGEFVGISNTTPDVVVRYGSVPERLENLRSDGWKFQANADELLIKTNTIANVLVSQGKRVIVQPKPGMSESDFSTLFMGWVMGALLHQRNTLPLHGSTVSVGNACVTFCAPSGTGKSSIATHMVKRGYPLLDDNIAAIDLIDGEYKVHPGSPTIKLPDDIVDRPEYSLATPRTFLPRLEKYVMPVQQNMASQPQALKKIYILKRGETKDQGLASLNGIAKFDGLMKNIFCMRFLQGMDKLSQQFRAIESIAARTPVIEVRLPDASASYDHVADLIEKDFSQFSGVQLDE